MKIVHAVYDSKLVLHDTHLLPYDAERKCSRKTILCYRIHGRKEKEKGREGERKSELVRGGK